MATTKDPIGDSLLLPDKEADPSLLGEIALNGTEIKAQDGIGVFNLRALPVPVQVGEVLYAAVVGVFSVELPITSIGGWLVNNDGILLIV
jgi:hypothetical protein